MARQTKDLPRLRDTDWYWQIDRADRDDYGDWLLAPVESHPVQYTHSVARSNFDVIDASIEGESYAGQHETIYAGYAALIVARPGSPAADTLAAWAAALDDYPIANEADLAMREQAAAADVWYRMTVRDRIATLAELSVPWLRARYDDIPQGIYADFDLEGEITWCAGG